MTEPGHITIPPGRTCPASLDNLRTDITSEHSFAGNHASGAGPGSAEGLPAETPVLLDRQQHF